MKQTVLFRCLIWTIYCGTIKLQKSVFEAFQHPSVPAEKQRQFNLTDFHDFKQFYCVISQGPICIEYFNSGFEVWKGVALQKSKNTTYYRWRKYKRKGNRREEEISYV